MDNQRLEELLTAAGRDADSPIEPAPELAGRVVRLHARRRRVRRTAAGGAVAAILVAAALTAHYYGRNASSPHPVERPMAGNPNDQQSQPPEPNVPEPNVPEPNVEDEIERLRAEVRRLRAEAEQREALVAELLDRQRVGDRLDELQRELDGPDPAELARMEFEKAAFLMVDHAGRPSPSADDEYRAGEYRRAIELFPNTHWARVAQERLGQTSPDR